MAKLKPKLRRAVAPPEDSKPSQKPPSKPSKPPETKGAETDYLAFGNQSQEQVAQYREQVSTPLVRDFFITAAEVQKGGGNLTVRTHLLFNYAEKEWNASAPFISVMENGRPNLYLTPGNDCALQAGGLTPSVRPIYLLMDHRVYSTKDGKKGTDGIKMWTPQSAVVGLLEAAIKDLKENLDSDEVENLDVRDYELKITKTGTGRGSTWALSFLARPKPLSEVQVKIVETFFDCEGEVPLSSYRKYLGSVIKPSSKYLLSRNGNRPYQRVPTPSQDDGDDPPPF